MRTASSSARRSADGQCELAGKGAARRRGDQGAHRSGALALRLARSTDGSAKPPSEPNFRERELGGFLVH